jgi:ABC-2 type transport system permease protein
VRRRQFAALARRSIQATFRQPQSLFPALLFPLVLIAVNAASLQRSTRLPGFPEVDSMLDFLLATSIVHGVLIGSITGGTDIARDIEDGFFDRLLLAPAPRSGLLVGRLAGAIVFASMQAALFITVLTLFGASVKGGFPAAVTLLATAAVLGLAVGALSAAIALRTGSAEAVSGFFPLVFILIFTSSAFFPRPLMSGWFEAVATYNPISWIVEAMRHLVIVGFDIPDALRAVGVAAGLSVITLSIALRQLRRRLAAA